MCTNIDKVIENEIFQILIQYRQQKYEWIHDATIQIEIRKLYETLVNNNHINISKKITNLEERGIIETIHVENGRYSKISIKNLANLA